MEILIFSDSHGKTEGMQRALKAQIRRPDLILHLGDGIADLAYLQNEGIPVLAVRGNCDWFGADDIAEERIFEEYGHRFLLVHGHRYGVKGGIGGLLAHAATIGADIVLFGHTHQPVELCVPVGELVGNTILERPIYLFNPGSIGKREYGDGFCFGTLSLLRDRVLFSHGSIE